ncbi:MAG TPA: type II toxin-antitoxin system death-on-curing family toxin [Thermoanaerobaculia bacterium]|nr:type II toxin-antitoxin system death-on-curing family toxin [Thermoanaerobaculia bacterium]
MRALSAADILYIHARVIEQSGGSMGLRDAGALESSVAQPMQSFDGVELYGDVPSKAAALAFFLASNHPFVDGNKRVAHAAMVVTLRLNGYSLAASIDDQETIMLQLASGALDRESFHEWVRTHTLGPPG